MKQSKERVWVVHFSVLDMDKMETSSHILPISSLHNGMKELLKENSYFITFIYFMKKMRNVLVTVKNFLRSLEEFKQGKVKKNQNRMFF